MPDSTQMSISLLGEIMAERDQWERDRSGSMSETRGFLGRNGLRHVSPAQVWECLGPVFDALDAGVGRIVELERTGPARKAKSKALAESKARMARESRERRAGPIAVELERCPLTVDEVVWIMDREPVS